MVGCRQNSQVLHMQNDILQGMWLKVNEIKIEPHTLAKQFLAYTFVRIHVCKTSHMSQEEYATTTDIWLVSQLRAKHIVTHT